MFVSVTTIQHIIWNERLDGTPRTASLVHSCSARCSRICKVLAHAGRRIALSRQQQQRPSAKPSSSSGFRPGQKGRRRGSYSIMDTEKRWKKRYVWHNPTRASGILEHHKDWIGNNCLAPNKQNVFLWLLRQRVFHTRQGRVFS